MNDHLKPLTVGYDWEMAVLSRTGENVEGSEVERIADELRSRLPWAGTGTDCELLESRSGPVASFAELLHRSLRFESELTKILKQKGYVLYKAGSRALEREPIGSHIHVGSIVDWTTAVRIQNAMAPYVAPLASLMANSPIYRERHGEYKSYRVASFAEWCSSPQYVVRPWLSQPTWGADVCVKLYLGPTVELRVCDGASSVRLMCEVAVLVAGLMYNLSQNLEEGEGDVESDEFKAIMINRWRASKYGLQSSFIWKGEELPAETLLTRVVGMAQDGMRLLGASDADLVTVRAMLRKRQTQADFQLAVFEKDNGDAHRYQRTMANIQRDPSAFEKYLRRAPVLPPIKPEEYEDALLSVIEVETPFSNILRASPLGPAQLGDMLSRLVTEGRLTVGRSRLHERVFTNRAVVEASGLPARPLNGRAR